LLWFGRNGAGFAPVGGKETAMLACFAALTLITAPMGAITPLAQEVEREARVLRADIAQAGEPAFQASLIDFSEDAMALSKALREAGVSDDLPCIFKGISEDTLVKAEAVRTASPTLKPIAMSQLGALLDDAILLAPMAAQVVSRDDTAADRR
jgi:hypothetical protein